MPKSMPMPCLSFLSLSLSLSSDCSSQLKSDQGWVNESESDCLLPWPGPQVPTLLTLLVSLHWEFDALGHTTLPPPPQSITTTTCSKANLASKKANSDFSLTSSTLNTRFSALKLIDTDWASLRNTLDLSKFTQAFRSFNCIFPVHSRQLLSLLFSSCDHHHHHLLIIFPFLCH